MLAPRLKMARVLRNPIDVESESSLHPTWFGLTSISARALVLAFVAFTAAGATAEEGDQRAIEKAVAAVTTGGGAHTAGDLIFESAMGQAAGSRAASPRYGIEIGVRASAYDPQTLFYDGFESGNTTAWSTTTGGQTL
jgi:hypothetical protein